jgi:hypothetical protein
VFFLQFSFSVVQYFKHDAVILSEAYFSGVEGPASLFVWLNE